MASENPASYDPWYAIPGKYSLSLPVKAEFLDYSVFSLINSENPDVCSNEERINFELGLTAPISVPLVVRDFSAAINFEEYKVALKEKLGVTFEESCLPQDSARPTYYSLGNMFLRYECSNKGVIF